MEKIGILVPRAALKQLADRIIERENIENCEVKAIETKDAVSEARAMIANGCNVIIARGRQARLIKENTKIPVVEIKMTGQELGILIQRAKNMVTKEYPRIAIIGFEEMFSNMEYMGEIFNVDLKKYFYKEVEEQAALVEQACKEGCDVILGGDMVLNCAKDYSVKTLFLETNDDSLKLAIDIAKTVLYTRRNEREQQAQLLTIVDTVLNGVIRINTNKKIIAINNSARIITGVGVKDVIGADLGMLMKNLDLSYVDMILEGKREVLNTSIEVRNNNYLVSIAPVVLDDDIEEAVITINQQQGRNKVGERAQENFFSGYLSNGDFSKIRTKNEKMKDCISLARMYALSSTPVLIYGETGTEKEVFAQGIHNSSSHKNAGYITVNCSGMDEEQQVKVLFGDSETQGAMEKAGYGTLVIRDISELSSRCQYRLLRALRYKTFLKTDIEEIPAFSARIIATSREDLGELVRKGLFRADLYYIFNSFSIRIPALRDRVEDIGDLVGQYLGYYNNRYTKRVVLTAGGLKEILQGKWEGNALQLELFCERLALTTPKRRVDEIVIRQMLGEMYEPGINMSGKEEPKKENINIDEEVAIRNCLIRFSGSRQKTADELGISVTTLWRKMKKYGITEDGFEKN